MEKLKNWWLENNHKYPKPLIKTMWIGFFCFWIGGYVFMKGVANDWGGLFGAMPSIEELQNPKATLASEILSSDGQVLGRFYRSNRSPLTFDEISPMMLNALYATEDIRFRDHAGIDMRGSLSVPFYLIRGKKKGASTITQQLAKNLFETRRNKAYKGKLARGPIAKIIAKAKEWALAVELERMYSKDEIVTMYLNTVFFGSNSYGLKVASNTFFGKDQKELKAEEAALLTGLLKGPSLYNPINHPDNALSRRNTVLDQMNKYDKIPDDQLEKLQKLPLGLNVHLDDHNNGPAPYFRSVLSNFMSDWCEENGYDLYADGLKIHTTIDYKLQQYAEQAVTEQMKEAQTKFFDHWKDRDPWNTGDDKLKQKTNHPFLRKAIKKTSCYEGLKKAYGSDTVKIEAELNKKHKVKVFAYDGPKEMMMSSYDSLRYFKMFLHAGFIALDSKTSQIRAWVGGVNHEYFQYDHVYQGMRQPGSTFKPLVYASIMGESGGVIDPCTKYVDQPVTYITDDPTNPIWTPDNADGGYTGDTLTLRQALAQSKNSITAQLMQQFGDQTPDKVRDYAMKMGIDPKGVRLKNDRSICLGVYDASLFEMAGAYATFTNKGYYTKPRFVTKIEDRDGNIIATFEEHKTQVLSESLAATMLYMLRGGTEERKGTGCGLYRFPDVWGKGNMIGTKTGTTQGNSDAWFMAVTKDLVCGAWVGGEDRVIHFRTADLGQGSRLALPIYGNFMSKVYNDTTTHVTRGVFSVFNSHYETDANGEKKLVNAYNFKCGSSEATKADEETLIQDNKAVDEELMD